MLRCAPRCSNELQYLFLFLLPSSPPFPWLLRPPTTPAFQFIPSPFHLVSLPVSISHLCNHLLFFSLCNRLSSSLVPHTLLSTHSSQQFFSLFLEYSVSSPVCGSLSLWPSIPASKNYIDVALTQTLAAGMKAELKETEGRVSGGGKGENYPELYLQCSSRILLLALVK